MTCTKFGFLGLGCFMAHALVGCSGHVEVGRNQAGSGEDGASDTSSSDEDASPDGSVDPGPPPVVQCISDPGAPAPSDAEQPGTCPCTRRDSVATLQCPVTNFGHAGAFVDEAGGLVALADGDSVPVELTIPPGALSGRTFVRITRTQCPPPFAYNDWSPVYQIDPPGLVLAEVATLSIPWDAKEARDSSNGAISVPTDLGIYLSTGDAFERVGDSYTNAGFSEATVSRLGSVFVGNPKTPDQTDCH